MRRQKITLSIDAELIQFAKEYAKKNYTSVSELVRQFLVTLKKEMENETATRNQNPNEKISG
jgi:Arc/MetJ-type ribon-helix-helix transcriptional regulator